MNIKRAVCLEDTNPDAPIKLFYGEIEFMCKPSRSWLTHGSFQVGLLEGFEELDPTYYTLEGAAYRAHKLSWESGQGSLVIYPAAYAVWDMPSGDIKFIFYCGQGFQP